MGIDRTEEGDAAERVAVSGATADADIPLQPDRQEQATENARYRSLVQETEAAAARDAWAQALPGFRSEWERLEQRYPERTQAAARTQPDGSWVAGGDRKLDPEQNAEATKACQDIRAEGTEVILPAMQRVEAADQERQLAGLEHMLKGEDRLKEKIADELLGKTKMTVEQALDKVPDAVRFTLLYSSERYADGVRADVERLKAEGFELIKLKNLWTDEQYKGINSQWRRPETGQRFEVQFHTPESLEAKELTHKAYERIRSTHASLTERSELKAFQRQVNALLVTPAGTAEIEDFTENDDG